MHYYLERSLPERGPEAAPVLFHKSGVPYVPPVPVQTDRPGTTWRHEILRAAHDSLHASHVRGKTLVAAAGSVGWWETLADSARRWQDKCAMCAAYLRKANVVARLRSHHGLRPFLKLMFDLVEVSPAAVSGAQHVLTVICTFSKYVWFRECHDKSAKCVALGLFHIILDAGVCPVLVQADLGREVYNAIMSELLSLLGISTLSPSQYKPTSEGMIERPHQELRKVMAVGIRALAVKYKGWPKLLPIAEARLRHKPLNGTGVTPFALVHGFFGTTPLQTVTGQVAMIPEHVSCDDWIQGLVRDTKAIWESFNTAREEQTAQQRAYDERARVGVALPYRVGDVVYWRKPFLPDPARREQDPLLVPKRERRKLETVHKSFLQRSEGPLAVYQVQDAHNVYIRDPFTKVCAVHDVLTGEERPVSTRQLIKLATTEAEVLAIDAHLRGMPRPPFFVDDLLLLEVEGRKVVGRVVKAQPGEGALRVQPMVARNQGALIKRRWKDTGSQQNYPTGTARARLEMDGDFRLTEASAAAYAAGSQPAQQHKRAEILSFGYDTNKLRVANRQSARLVDARVLKHDPNDDRRAKRKTGKSRLVQDMVMGQEGANELVEQVCELVRQSFRVAVGCVHGKHRSVTIAEVSAGILRAEGLTCDVRHLNLGDAGF